MTPHAGQVVPPQSAALSSPFMIRSVQVAAAQVFVVASQTSSEQSVPTLHVAPTLQGAQSGPPQSTSVSEEFRRPSVQAGSTQTFERAIRVPSRFKQP